MARRELGPAALQVARAVRSALPARGAVVLGVSGGADSMAMAAGAAWALRARGRCDDQGPSVVATIVDHGLQAGSAEVAATVADRVRALGLAAEVIRVDVVPDGDGPEAAARTARLGALRWRAADGVLLLGHTLDDQAETVLLGLARGSGTRSLAGMRPAGEGIIRPLLGLRRDLTRRACAEWGIEVWDDPHNAEDRFARVRVRRTVLPVLEAELGPGIVEALARTAALARADADALDALAATERTRLGERPDCAALAGMPEAISSRVVRGWLVDHGAVQPGAVHVGAVLGLVTRWRGQGAVQLPGLQVRRVADRLVAIGPSVPMP